jgi:hypothetical protein
MKRIFAAAGGFLLALSLAACTSGAGNQPSAGVPVPSATADTESEGPSDTGRLIRITTRDGDAIVFSLNDSRAAKGLCDQLPLTVEVENYSSDEKIWYPPEKLDTGDTPLAQGPAGTLAYFAPWGNVAVYYGDCGGASGLYMLGEAVSGIEYLPGITGEIRIETVGPSVSWSEPAISVSGTT